MHCTPKASFRSLKGEQDKRLSTTRPTQPITLMEAKSALLDFLFMTDYDRAFDAG